MIKRRTSTPPRTISVMKTTTKSTDYEPSTSASTSTSIQSRTVFTGSPPMMVLVLIIVSIVTVSAFTSSPVTTRVVQHSLSSGRQLPPLFLVQQHQYHRSTTMTKTSRRINNVLSKRQITSSSTPSRPTTVLHMELTRSLNEKVMEKLPSPKVIDAVIESKSVKLVASDVATRAGVSLAEARKDLTTLASLSRGDISVSSDGELVYEFPSDLKNVLASNSAKYKALQQWEKAWPTVFWGIRVSFGVALLASVALIFSTIFVLQTSAGGSSDDDRRDNRRSGGGGGGSMMSFGGPSYFWGPSPFDFFYYRPYGGYGYYGQPVTERPRDPEDMGFLESIFSFVFGDGNPNAGLEERRLSLVAQMIRDNKGAVTAEQLAPYCDAPDPDLTSGQSYVDESFVLPIVSQLDGEPRVTEDGDIIYVFPDLQVSASPSRVLSQASEQGMILKRAGLPPNATPKEIQNLLMINGISIRGARDKQDLIEILEKALPPMTPSEEDEFAQSDPTMLLEREYKFSVASGLNKFFAGALGVLNLGGALYLGNLLNQYALYNVRLPSFLGVAQTFYPLLLGYAVLFNAVPIARNLWISAENAKIQKRNEARKKWRERALRPGATIIRKLKAATKFATNRKLLSEQDMVYDTKQGASDLQQTQNLKDLDEFDKLLKEEKPFQ